MILPIDYVLLPLKPTEQMKHLLALTFLLLQLNFAMAQNEILFNSALNLANDIQSGKITSRQVVSAFIAQIEKENSSYNAVVLLNKEAALKRAEEADAALAAGEMWGKLHGLPITVKDNFKTKNIITTAGYPPLRNSVPDVDAEVVKLLLAEGAIIIGKTNLSVLAMDMQADNPVFGKTNNPWDTTRTSGGSSGGCAAALSSGMTPLTFGNDLAGSIRLPSAYCGVFGFKPSFGTVSLKGIQTDPKEPTDGLKTLAVAGPLARDIDDLVLA
jgi:amidase